MTAMVSARSIEGAENASNAANTLAGIENRGDFIRLLPSKPSSLYQSESKAASSYDCRL
jgi:hypothetical protein